MRVCSTVSDYTAHYFRWCRSAGAAAAGHDLRVACAPSQQAAISRAGLVAVPILGRPGHDGARPDLLLLRRLNGKNGLPLHPAPGNADEHERLRLPAYKRENKDPHIGAVAASMDAASRSPALGSRT